MSSMSKRLLQVAAVLGVLIGPGLMVAQAGYLNLTTTGANGTINNAIFAQGAQLSGTGVFPAFVQVAGGGSPLIHEAYNTTVNNVLDNGSSSTFNHEIKLSDVPIFTTGGVAYYSFFLDINESHSAAGDQYLSLDALKIITSNTPNQSSTPLPSGTLRYDIGSGNGVLLNFDLEPGSGRADMELLVPTSLFAGAETYVYLYSKFGVLGTLGAGNAFGAPPGIYSNSDGFEEWAFGRSGSGPIVPEPSSIVLALSAFAGLGGLAGWRQHRKLRKGSASA